jgi:hypothetical protein
MVGLPLFIPQINEDGVSTGFANTRMWAFHQGMRGWLSADLSWKTLATYSKHYGQHGAEYDTPKELLSLAMQLNYSLPKRPLHLSLKLAFDHGTVMESGFGAELRLIYRLY